MEETIEVKAEQLSKTLNCTVKPLVFVDAETKEEVVGFVKEPDRLLKLRMLDKNLGLKLGTMEERVLAMSKKLRGCKDVLAEEVQRELPHAKIVKRISTLVGKRCASLKKQGVV